MNKINFFIFAVFFIFLAPTSEVWPQENKKFLSIGQNPVNANRPLNGRVRVAIDQEIEVLSQDRSGKWARGWLKKGEVLAGFYTPDSTCVRADWIFSCGNPVLGVDKEPIYIRVAQKKKPPVIPGKIPMTKTGAKMMVEDVLPKEFSTIVRFEMPPPPPAKVEINLAKGGESHFWRNAVVVGLGTGILGGSLLILQRSLSRDPRISVVVNNPPPANPTPTPTPGPANNDEDGPGRGNAKIVFPGPKIPPPFFFRSSEGGSLTWDFRMQFTILKF